MDASRDMFNLTTLLPLSVSTTLATRVMPPKIMTTTTMAKVMTTTVKKVMTTTMKKVMTTTVNSKAIWIQFWLRSAESPREEKG